MRRSCTIYGPGSLVHSVAATLEKAGFDAATVERDDDKPNRQEFPTPWMAMIVVLDRNSDITTPSSPQGVSTTRSETTTKLKPRRGRPRKIAPAVLTPQNNHEATQPPPAADDIPF